LAVVMLQFKYERQFPVLHNRINALDILLQKQAPVD